jgi:hypothetical protein
MTVARTLTFNPEAESTQWYYRKPPAVKVPLASDWSESIKELVSKGHGFIDQNTIEGLKDPETVEALRWGLSLSLEDAVTRRQEFRVALGPTSEASRLT